MTFLFWVVHAVFYMYICLKTWHNLIFRSPPFLTFKSYGYININWSYKILMSFIFSCMTGYEEDNMGGRGLSGLPERCHFWPNCKNSYSCPYHHPSVPCRLFPNSKYGNKCHFIHRYPQCKFDARWDSSCVEGGRGRGRERERLIIIITPLNIHTDRCTRADCPYLHTALRHLLMSYSSPVVAPPPAPIAPIITNPSSLLLLLE